MKYLPVVRSRPLAKGTKTLGTRVDLVKFDFEQTGLAVTAHV